MEGEVVRDRHGDRLREGEEAELPGGGGVLVEFGLIGGVFFIGQLEHFEWAVDGVFLIIGGDARVELVSMFDIAGGLEVISEEGGRAWRFATG